MTDERQGEALWPALRGLPRGSGVIVRHHGLRPAERLNLIARIRKIACRRDLVLIVAGSAALARQTKTDGFHQRSGHIGPPDLLRTVAVHDLAELRLAERVAADLAFLSPAFGTDSHPGAKPLGRVRFGQIAQQARVPIIALGGMNAERAESLRDFNIYGWAGIGALTPK